MGYRWLTMLWQFQLNSKGTQRDIYMYPFSPNLFSHPGCTEHCSLSTLNTLCSSYQKQIIKNRLFCPIKLLWPNLPKSPGLQMCEHNSGVLTMSGQDEHTHYVNIWNNPPLGDKMSQWSPRSLWLFIQMHGVRNTRISWAFRRAGGTGPGRGRPGCPQQPRLTPSAPEH